MLLHACTMCDSHCQADPQSIMLVAPAAHPLQLAIHEHSILHTNDDTAWDGEQQARQSHSGLFITLERNLHASQAKWMMTVAQEVQPRGGTGLANVGNHGHDGTHTKICAAERLLLPTHALGATDGTSAACPCHQ